ncbi:MAG TPA: 4-hydroxy-3-methylbut-2-enyl diphosphate reductase [Bacillota bacterium]
MIANKQSRKKILIGEKAGCCFGVNRALKIAAQTRKNHSGKVYTLGPLIHNPRVIQKLADEGITPIESLDQAAPGGILIIRSHGVGPQLVAAAKDKGLQIVDATCPFVKQEQKLAMGLLREGYEVVVVGEASHAEVTAVVDSLFGQALVIAPDDLTPLAEKKLSPRVGVVCQTTQSQEGLNRVVNALLPLVKELKIHNTICSATTQRQNEVWTLAEAAQVLLVIGGKNSANTRHLAEIGASLVPTYHIEDTNEIKPEWFRNINTIGITAGASTPQEQIEEVVNWLEENLQEELEWTKEIK